MSLETLVNRVGKKPVACVWEAGALRFLIFFREVGRAQPLLDPSQVRIYLLRVREFQSKLDIFGFIPNRVD